MSRQAREAGYIIWQQDSMDYKFPSQLFPSYFNSGPPNVVVPHNVGGWGSYGQAFCVNRDGSTQNANWRFATQHQVKGEAWSPMEPIVVPMLPPGRGNAGSLWSSTASDPQDFSKHMENFYLGNYQDAFGTMSSLLGENFFFEQGKRKKCDRHAIHMWQTKDFMDKLAYKKCEFTSMPERIKKYSSLLDDIIHDVPPDLLAGLLYEELSHQSELEQFSDSATGGALAYIPFRQNIRATTQHGCLMYPADSGFSSLNLHKVSLKCLEGKAPCMNIKKNLPFTFQLNGTIRQISTGVQMNECHVGVRSDYMCGVLSVSEKTKPKLLQVVQTEEPATCLTVSPHILGELLVATESGAAFLWRLGEGLQRCRVEDSNLYFNAKSPWRWCDFSGHPRVVVYSDRTGVELTDIRTKPSSSHTLFRIGRTPACKSGERVILPKYLREVHTFHHLVTTQHSAYILDERFPCIPMLKWDHMMDYPPMFAEVLAGPASSSGGGVNKILLGSQCSQELTLLQYSGGREVACCSRGPPQALLKPRDSLLHLPVQIPHRHHTAQQRLARPAAGLTFIQQKGAEERICVLQLTEAGDIFYQTLRLHSDDGVPEERTEEQSLSGEKPEWPSEGPVKHWSRARKRTLSGMSLESRESSGLEMLEVVINDEPDLAQMDLSDNETNRSQEIPIMSLPSYPTVINKPPPPKMSDETLRKWKRWLLKLAQQSNKKPSLQHCTIETKDLLKLPGNTRRRRNLMDEDCRQSMRKDLREGMRKGELLVHGTTNLPTLDPVSVPSSVKASEWSDDLSHRLVAAWEGGWKGWWEEKLGMNRGEKEEALRRKRRRQKQSRALQRAELSGSFTSSVGYQSNLDFSGGSGWSSASHSAWSDADVDSRFSNSQTDVLSEAGLLTASPPLTPQRKQHTTPRKEEQALMIPCKQQQTAPLLQRPIPHKPPPPQQTPITSQAQSNRAEIDAPLAAVSRPQALKKPKCPSEDYLSSLFGSQEASQSQDYILDDGDPAFSAPLATSSQLSRLSVPQRTPRRGLPLSQSSQPKRKKSRMGF